MAGSGVEERDAMGVQLRPCDALLASVSSWKDANDKMAPGSKALSSSLSLSGGERKESALYFPSKAAGEAAMRRGAPATLFDRLRGIGREVELMEAPDSSGARLKVSMRARESYRCGSRIGQVSCEVLGLLESQEAVGYWFIQEPPNASQRTPRNVIPERPDLAVRVPLVARSPFVFLPAAGRVTTHFRFPDVAEFRPAALLRIFSVFSSQKRRRGVSSGIIRQVEFLPPSLTAAAAVDKVSPECSCVLG